MPTQTEIMERIVALCRRRGFIFGSSEIYGGIGGFWDYGPLGCELKKNIKDVWWEDMVRNPPPGPNGREFQMVGVDCSIIMNPKVWEASGHVTGFADPMVDCKAEGCKGRFRADKVWLVTVLPKGSVQNQKSALAGAPDVQIATGTQSISIAFESETAGVGYLVEEAVQRYARTHNIARLKRFRSGAEGTPAPRYLYLQGLDPQGTDAADEERDYAFDCLVEPLTTAMFSDGRRPCPKCHSEGSLTEPRQFNLMNKTFVGALEDSSSVAYLRPETAQGIFANFRNVMDSTRVRIPFGIAQVGKAFRNEINPRNYTFRSREFEQMEIEFFCHPEESRMWYEYWRDVRINWYTQLGIKSDKLRPREQGKEELAHYSCGTTDIEYLFPFSDEPQELEGVAHRGDFDLKAHGKHAKGDENAFAVVDDDPQSRDRTGGEENASRGLQPAQPGGNSPRASRYVPHVIEPSAGADRFTLAVLCEAYSFDESRASPEFMKFHPRLAPIKAAVFPLVAKDGLPEIAEPIFRDIKKHYPCQYDAKQSIGKRYARMDEAGTPFCFTIDGQTKEDGTVTVRNRDDAGQIRIDKSRCLEYLRERLRL